MVNVLSVGGIANGECVVSGGYSKWLMRERPSF